MRLPKTNKSVFKKLFTPLMILLIFESVVVLCVFLCSGIIGSFTEKSYSIFSQKVAIRKTYIESEMKNTWSNIDTATAAVNKKVQEFLDTRDITTEQLCSNKEEYTALFTYIADDITNIIRNNSVTGSYVILNNEDITEEIQMGDIISKPCIYIRDYDPTDDNDEDNTDLSLMYGTEELAKKIDINKNGSWQSEIPFDLDTYNIFYTPYKQAKASFLEDYNELGYWSKNFSGTAKQESAITYTVPLVLEDGTAYGVIGVDVTIDYIAGFLPSNELSDNGGGAYILATYLGHNMYLPMTIDTELAIPNAYINIDATKQYADFKTSDNISMTTKAEPLSIYGDVSPYTNDQSLFLIGMLKTSDINTFAHELLRTIFLISILFLIVGTFGAVFIAYRIGTPINYMYKKVLASNALAPIKLPYTGISEIDTLVNSIEDLSIELFDVSKKFSDIIKLSSVKIAAFEISEDGLFITDNFFEVLPICDKPTSELTIEEFEKILYKMNMLRVNEDKEANESTLHYKKDNVEIWVKFKLSSFENKSIGLIEDITEQTIAIKRLSDERDMDPLTNLLNRRAFLRHLENLFSASRDKLKISAMVMMDIDNLKYINDSYGHDFGDLFIRSTAKAIKEGLKEANVLFARISGDEFYAFFYGYDEKQEILKYIEKIKESLANTDLALPQNPNYKIRVSGGIAWYPENSTEYATLMTYADFAMYTIKRNTKGEFSQFDKNVYDENYYLLSGKEEFNNLIENELVEFHFQPIVSAATGEVFGYEALMRSKLDFFKSPKEILKMAESEAKLYRIERLTMFKGFEFYEKNLAAGTIAPNAKLFMNSIANQCLQPDIAKEFIAQYAKYFENVVFEITEGEELSAEAFSEKVSVVKGAGAGFALDDYGAGYSNSTSLLDINPEFVKIDMYFIRDVNTDKQKQTIVKHIVNLCHSNGIKIIAEGIETYAEMETLINLGIDYLQGFYLAKPALKPPKIASAVAHDIRSIYRAMN